MRLLNSSGLYVDIPEATPTLVNNWSTPVWTKGSALGSPNAAPLLSNSLILQKGSGIFGVGGMTGIRGSVLVQYVAGAQGNASNLAALGENPVFLANRIVLGIDSLNRPEVTITDSLGVTKAAISACYAPIASGTSVLAILSWDSTVATDGARFASLLVQGGTVPSSCWTVNPTAAWTSFKPSFAFVGMGAGISGDFNGTVTSFQVSNNIYAAGSTSAVWSFPAIHSLEKSPVDASVMTDTSFTDVVTRKPVVSDTLNSPTDTVSFALSKYYYLADTAVVSDSVGIDKSVIKTLTADTPVVSDSVVITRFRDVGVVDTLVTNDTLAYAQSKYMAFLETSALTDVVGTSIERARVMTTDTVGTSDSPVLTMSKDKRTSTDTAVLTDGLVLTRDRSVVLTANPEFDLLTLDSVVVARL